MDGQTEIETCVGQIPAEDKCEELRTKILCCLTEDTIVRVYRVKRFEPRYVVISQKVLRFAIVKIPIKDALE